jgi:large subunit ribosomal protein L29
MRDLTDDELANKLHESRQELFHLRFQSATGGLEDSSRLRLTRREIARILSVRNEREAHLETK